LGKLQEEQTAEIQKIEKQYEIKKSPLYKQRAEILKKIPGFWKKTVGFYLIFISIFISIFKQKLVGISSRITRIITTN